MTSLAQRLGFPTWAWVKGVHCGRKTRRAARPAERRFLRVPQQAAYQGEDAANPGAEGVGCRKETASHSLLRSDRDLPYSSHSLAERVSY